MKAIITIIDDEGKVIEANRIVEPSKTSTLITAIEDIDTFYFDYKVVVRNIKNKI